MIKNKLIIYALFLLVLAACKPAEQPAEDAWTPVSPVQVTTIKDSNLVEYVELTAISAYLENSYIKSNINGYVSSTTAELGKQVAAHSLLFTLVTKEARAIGNTVNRLDPDFKFSGVTSIRADQPGIIVQVNHQKGDYVQDGELMATISNRLVFLLEVPYEYKKLTQTNKELKIILPDGQEVSGRISGIMPAVDTLAQSQRYIIQVNTKQDIPQGLIAKVRLVRFNRPHAQVVPKTAVLSNETEDDFWVMKMINDSVAVKIRVKKGVESNQTVELLSPLFSKTDRILYTGNYGIADTAKVKIQR